MVAKVPSTLLADVEKLDAGAVARETLGRKLDTFEALKLQLQTSRRIRLLYRDRLLNLRAKRLRMRRPIPRRHGAGAAALARRTEGVCFA